MARLPEISAECAGFDSCKYSTTKKESRLTCTYYEWYNQENKCRCEAAILEAVRELSDRNVIYNNEDEEA